MPTEYLLIDGKDKIMGRLASQVAKLALLGKNVVVINAKDIVISGSKKNIFSTYVQMKNRKTRSNPTRGPFFHRRPDALFRRTVRGMLPFKKPRGQEAYKRVHAYVNGVEKGKYPKLIPHEIPDVGLERLNGKYVTLEMVGERFGWKNIES
ncbi:MAG: 50S ribosomal protein L13 [Candidatus Hodarchaeota archaeon]